MNINLTFIVQIANFWLAYWLLSRFLFKPFVVEYLRKKELKNAVLENMRQQERDLNELIEEKKRALLDFKDQMKIQYSEQIQNYEVMQELLQMPVESSFVPQEGAKFVAQKVLDAYRN